jgi:transcription initiation factor TFIID TATA-box-binding protein
MRKRKYTESSNTVYSQSYTEDVERYVQGMAGDAPPAEVHNLVGTCRIHSNILPLDLRHVSRLLPNTNFDKQKFAAITLRLYDPVCTVLLFTSGKLVLTGSKTFADCILACHRVLRLLRQGIPGAEFSLADSNIQNIVGNVDLKLGAGETIDLQRFHATHSVFCTYQKNMFPGLIFRPLNCPVVLLLFTSGKIVLTGAKSSQSMHAGWRDIWPKIAEFIVRAPAATGPS